MGIRTITRLGYGTPRARVVFDRPSINLGVQVLQMAEDQKPPEAKKKTSGREKKVQRGKSSGILQSRLLGTKSVNKPPPGTGLPEHSIKGSLRARAKDFEKADRRSHARLGEKSTCKSEKRGEEQHARLGSRATNAFVKRELRPPHSKGGKVRSALSGVRYPQKCRECSHRVTGHIAGRDSEAKGKSCTQ